MKKKLEVLHLLRVGGVDLG